MPIIVCETHSQLAADTKARLAKEITDGFHDVIKSPLELISVVFHDLTPENTYRAGLSSDDETLIFCHVRAGRTDGALLRLLERVSSIWSEVTGDPEDKIEMGICQYPAKFTMRGGVRLPEPPIV
ncbi:MAG: tautomerase family protein [Mycobacterium sp.]